MIYGNNLKNKLERDVVTKSADIVNGFTSTATDKALSAAAGKDLNDHIVLKQLAFTPVSPSQSNYSIFAFNAFTVGDLAVIEYNIVVTTVSSSALAIGSLDSFQRSVLGQYVADVPAHGDATAQSSLAIIVDTSGTVKCAFGTNGKTYYGTLVIPLK